MSNPTEQGSSDEPDPPDPLVIGESALRRAREIARRIAERVRQLTGDTKPDQPALPPDSTEEAPPTQ